MSGSHQGTNLMAWPMHKQGSAVVRIGFRATKNAGMLLASPTYYTEVRFQGVVE